MIKKLHVPISVQFFIIALSLVVTTTDYMQEGRILLWQVALQKTYRRACFKKYFTSAIRFRFSNLFRDYILKNLVRIGEYQDFYGNLDNIRLSLGRSSSKKRMR